MRLLLDTHIFVWFASERDRLSRRERAALAASDQLLVSLLSLWELRVKWRKSTAKAVAQGLITPQHALKFIERARIELAPLTADDVVAVLNPPITHKDPFDEMLLVHAQQLGARLITRDPELRAHPLAYPL